MSTKKEQQAFEAAVKFMQENEQALTEITTEVYKEICSSVEKHGSMPEDIIHRAGIVCEESGELIRASINLVYEGGDPGEVYKEAVHTAATAIKFILYLQNNK